MTMRLLLEIVLVVVVIVMEIKYIKKKLTKSKNQNLKSGNLVNLSKNKITKKTHFLILKARKTCSCLNQIFIKVLILLYFNLRYYI